MISAKKNPAGNFLYRHLLNNVWTIKNMKKTRIIATIGPACENIHSLKAMFRAGVNVCRLNFSFGTHEEHMKKIMLIRQAGNELNQSIAIMQDLQGPKIRIGKLNAPVTVKKGDKIILSGNSVHKEPLYLPTTYRNIASDTQQGKTILLADGRIILHVESVQKSKREVLCNVVAGGTILTGKGINLPYTKISIPALTPKDIEDVKFGIQAGVDYVALSFVRAADDIIRLRRLLKSHNADIPIIAKLEKPEAMDNLEAILDAADGVMVARGDLADEISFEHVPTAQKHIIRRANECGKLSIVATEMLSSMTDNPLPSRAEVSDVANAVLDGSDMVMLSNETATGQYPLDAVKAMAAIAGEAEKMLEEKGIPQNAALNGQAEITRAMCMASSLLSHELHQRAIVVLTDSGRTARIMAKCRPRCLIYAATYHEKTYRRLAAYHNVYPRLLNGRKGEECSENFFKQLSARMLNEKMAGPGDRVTVLTGISNQDNQWRLNAVHTITIPGKPRRRTVTA